MTSYQLLKQQEALLHKALCRAHADEVASVILAIRELMFSYKLTPAQLIDGLDATGADEAQASRDRRDSAQGRVSSTSVDNAVLEERLRVAKLEGVIHGIQELMALYGLSLDDIAWAASDAASRSSRQGQKHI